MADVKLQQPSGSIYVSAQIEMLRNFATAPGCKPEIQRKYLTSLLECADYSGAIDYAVRLLNDPHTGPDLLQGALHAAARALFEHGDLSGAKARCHRLLDQNPSDSVAQRLLGNCLLREGNPDEAMALLDRLLDRSPGDAPALNTYRIAASKIGKPEAASHKAQDLYRDGIRNGVVLSLVLDAGLATGDAEMSGLADFALGLIRFTPREDHQILAKADHRAIYDAIICNPDLSDPPAYKPATNIRRLAPLDQQILEMLKPVFQTAEAVLNHGLDQIQTAESQAAYTALFGSPPGTCRIDPWATVYDASGHHTPHTHLSWFSGVYYPAAADATSGDLCLGYANHPDPSAKKRISPKPGALVLFPSHIPHWTEPSAISTQRVSVAFDIYPAD